MSRIIVAPRDEHFFLLRRTTLEELFVGYSFYSVPGNLVV